ATYFISFAVWTGAAYTMVTTIRLVHGECTFEYIVRYLAAACVMQCILALIFQSHPELDAFFQRYTYTLGAEATANIGKTMQRLHGVGAAIDIAGTRFAAVLVLIVSMLCTNIQENKWKWFYLISWAIILVVGSMIARTTSVGGIISTLLFITSGLFLNTPSKIRRTVLISFSYLLIIFVPICTHLYRTNKEFNENLRFGFEGIFNFVENGRLETSSSNKLKTMYVFPENTKTWLIGDGYFEQQKYDPYYTGRDWVLFYMGTDVGYCRFIFYFGLIGLAAFVYFFLIVCRSCIKGFRQYQWTFVFLFLLNLIIWLKVSTDIYLVFAPFICMIAMKEQEPA
ncbi:MAG: hypothetical protein HUJ90_02785, partial [Bacteroidales bacterium]|nr:hypothetical protein [Bacteroidales bacterium]